jgi:hypothetical protein
MRAISRDTFPSYKGEIAMNDTRLEQLLKESKDRVGRRWKGGEGIWLKIERETGGSSHSRLPFSWQLKLASSFAVILIVALVSIHLVNDRNSGESQLAAFFENYASAFYLTEYNDVTGSGSTGGETVNGTIDDVIDEEDGQSYDSENSYTDLLEESFAFYENLI